MLQFTETEITPIKQYMNFFMAKCRPLAVIHGEIDLAYRLEVQA